MNYLSSDELQKQQYLELVAGAAAACQPEVSDPRLTNTEVSRIIAEAALRVVKVRGCKAEDEGQLPVMITDAYATVAIAYRRAAALYVADEEMQQIGTAAVHMVTIASSYMAAHFQGNGGRVDSAGDPTLSGHSAAASERI